MLVDLSENKLGSEKIHDFILFKSQAPMRLTKFCATCVPQNLLCVLNDPRKVDGLSTI
jgi:hypothetical protein